MEQNKSPFQWSIGIDPGLNGATVAINLSDLSWAALVHGKIHRVDKNKISAYDYTRLIMPLIPQERHKCRIFVESAIMLPRQQGNDAIAVNWGKMVGAFENLGFDATEVRPVDWKKWFEPDVTVRHTHGKQLSVLIAEALGFVIPTLRPGGRVKDHNVADALCVAIYGAREVLDLRSLNG